MATRNLDVLATPSEVLAFGASLAGPRLVLIEANENLGRIDYQTAANALSFGVRVRLSVFALQEGSRIILDGRRAHPLNLTAGVNGALASLERTIRARFPVKEGTIL